MTMILSGLVSGAFTALALILLVEKSPPKIKQLLLGHYLFTDIVGTMLAYVFLPVVGLATMISASMVCVVLSLYLYLRRLNSAYTTVGQYLKW
jgi:hypothetical protein